MAKEFMYRGKTLEELQKLDLKEFAALIPARSRRSLVTRGMTDAQKRLYKKVQSGKNNIETHCRDMVIIPAMVGKTMKIHSGKEFQSVLILGEMLGHTLGEFALTRKKTAHSSPGVGAPAPAPAAAAKPAAKPAK